jgi:cytochrome c-type biogenesis protein CcmH
MPVFLALAAALTLGVLAVLLQPLWHGARGLALGIATVVVFSTLALYQLVGTPAALDPQVRNAPKTLADAIAQLETELARKPQQLDGWRLLGQAYTTEQRFDAARDAYAKAVALAPRDADVLVEAAQARAMAAPERKFDAAAIALLQRALQAQTQHQRARWFLGIAQRQAGQHAEAAGTWEALLAMVDAKTAASLRPQIDAARQAAGLPSLPPASATASDSATALQVTVELDPALAERVRLDGNARVFVIARVPDGPPMPVAVEQHAVQELPFTASLDDGDSPMPTRKLSALPEVELIARLSTRGDATPQAGDLESAPVRVRLPATQPIRLTIDQTIATTRD